MATTSELVRLPILRNENGMLRPIAGATVSIYSTVSSLSATTGVKSRIPGVDESGVVDPGSSLVQIFGDFQDLTTLNNPLISDAQGLVEFYAPRDDYSVLIELPDGSKAGIPFLSVQGASHAGSRAIDGPLTNIVGADFNLYTGSLFAVTVQGIGTRTAMQLFGTGQFILRKTQDNSDLINYNPATDAAAKFNMGVNANIGNKRMVIPTGTADPVAPAPLAGDMIFRTDLVELHIYTGAAWKKVVLT